MKTTIVKKIKAAMLVLVMGAGFIGGVTKIAGALTVTSIYLEKGPVAGGQEVTITGDFNQGVEWKQISAGFQHTCAIASNDQMYCWGGNSTGRLGDGTTTNSYTPVAVLLGDRPVLTVKQIAAGTNHTCAIASNDQVYCWGSNANGRLGDGTTTNSYTPVAVQLGDRPNLTVKQIAVGDRHTCAIASNDRVYCWGYNIWGQLGDGTGGPPGTYKSTPVAVQLGDRPDLTVKQITASDDHTCAIASNNQVYCWGSNGHGQLGDGTNSDRLTPVAVQLGDRPDLTVKQIVAGSWSTCAIASNNQAYCWGDNHWGQLGDGTTTDRYTPVAVQLGDRPDLTVKQITANGGNHTCAIASNDQVYCWGDNEYGSLGDGTTTGRYTPTAPQLGNRPDLTVKQITAGYDHTCAIASNDQVYCWGSNANGPLGIGYNTGPATCTPGVISIACSKTPVAVLLPPATYTVTMDPSGTPAPCTDVVVATDGKSLTCTTSAHIAGLVDVTVDNGVSAKTLVKGYEYVKDGSDGGGGSLIKDILSPDTGAGRVVGLLVLGEVVIVAMGVAVFFKIKKEEFR